MNEHEQPKVMTEDDADSRNETWKLKIKNGRFWFRRFIKGELEESYVHMNSDEASVAAVAIIQGYQPPFRLKKLDKPMSSKDDRSAYHALMRSGR